MYPSKPPRHDYPAAATGGTAGLGQAPAAADSYAGPSATYDIFADALDAAMALVQADGGALAILDETRHVMVLRARSSAHRQEAGVGYPPARALGEPGRPSQPLPPSGVPVGAGAGADLAVQATQLLPATATGTYRPGERLIGTCWETGQPQLLTGDQCRTLPPGQAPADPEALYHVAVPIYRPGVPMTPRQPGEVVGVITLYSNDPRWSFSTQHERLLTLHADRVARALHEIELARLAQSEADLLTFIGSDDLDDQDIFLRLRDVVRRAIPAPSFAILMVEARRPDLILRLGERDGKRFEPQRLPPNAVPRWWDEVRAGHTVCVSTSEDRAQHPDFCLLGFGDDTPVHSLLAAPLRSGEPVLGVMLAASNRSDAYAPEHVRLFTTIARTAGLVLQNRSLAEHKERKDQQLAKLNNALLTFHASLDLDAAVESLAKQAGHLADATVCLAFLLEQPSGESVDREWHSGQPVLVGRAASEPPPEPLAKPLTEVRLPLTWQSLSTALADGRLMLLDNLANDWNDGTPEGAFLADYRIRSCLVLPLLHAGDQIGVLLVHSPDTNYLFSPEEMGLLQGLASQGAVAIHNARLFQRLAEELERRKELDRLKEEFILTISHEFRTPVTAIEGYVGLIERHAERLDREKLDRYAQEIHQAATQLIGMITRLTDVSTMQERELQLTTAPVNVRHWVDQAISTLPLDAAQRILADVSADLWALADGERLGQVFSNLLGNAIKYSAADKPVRVSVWPVSRETLARTAAHHGAGGERAPERVLMASVRDFGDGIPAEDIKRLFHKFVRLPRSLTTSVRGTGLGLWICKKYVQAMGGEIWVESEVGSGADFRFWLALAPPPAEG
jgi:signal transduction histidine kinase